MSSTTRSGKVYSYCQKVISSPKIPTLILHSGIDQKKEEQRPAFIEPFPTRQIKQTHRDFGEDSSEKEEAYQQQYTVPPKYEVNIDFDEASRAWRANKRRVGESWVYKSTETETRTGTRTSSRIRNRNK